MTVHYVVRNIHMCRHTHMYPRKCYTPLSRNQHVRSISLVENFPLVAQSSRDETASLAIRRAIAQRSSNSQDKSGDAKDAREREETSYPLRVYLVARWLKDHTLSRTCLASVVGVQGGHLTTVYDGKRMPRWKISSVIL